MSLDGGGQSASSPQPGSDAAAMQHALQQQQQTIQALQAQLQQQHPPPPHRIVATIGRLEPFTGQGSALAAQQWLKKIEYRFTVCEAMLGIQNTSQATGARLLATADALVEEADRWFSGLPQAPATWAAFREAFVRRFAGVATTDAKLSELQRLVQTAQRVREKLNVDGLRRYATQFLQLAGEIPPEVMSDYLKRKSFAEGLPQKHAEYALSRNRSEHPPELHALVDDILARALDRAMSTATLGGSAGPQHGDAMQLDAVSLCAAQFGVSREEAARYVEPGEGWAVHDTGDGGRNAGPSSAPAPFPGPSSRAPDTDAVERLLAAFESRMESRFGTASGGAGSHGTQSRSQSQRRNVPGGVLAEVPAALLEARKAAGLCIRCGVTKYEGGNKGHNARSCRAPVDKTTPAAEGKKKAGF